MDDLDQFVVDLEREKQQRRSPTARWFSERPELGERLARAFHEQGYAVTTLYQYVHAKHDFPLRYSSLESWLKAHKPA